MAGTHRSNARTTRSGKRPKGAHRAKACHREPYGWLGAGALTLGMGAALASGSGIAHADPTHTGGSTSSRAARQEPHHQAHQVRRGSPTSDVASGHHRHAAPAVVADSTPTIAGSTPSTPSPVQHLATHDHHVGPGQPGGQPSTSPTESPHTSTLAGSVSAPAPADTAPASTPHTDAATTPAGPPTFSPAVLTTTPTTNTPSVAPSVPAAPVNPVVSTVVASFGRSEPHHPR